MRYLGIDYGTKRIGLAIGDDETGFAFPFMTVANQPGHDPVAAIATLVAEENVGTLVVGMPYRMSGEHAEKGETVVLIEQFVADLKHRLAIPVETEDERMTSAYVDRMRKDAGMKKEHFDKDATAAAAILDTYLTRKRNAA